jgi:nucleotide-binding universal stress UspA family protein
MAILVAYDGSRPAQKAVERAVSEHADQELVLLRVVEVAGGALGAGIDLVKERLKEEPEETAADLSEQVVDLLDSEAVEYRTETVVGRPGREIVSFAEDHDIDEIIVGSHGREGVSRVLIGSVAEEVVSRAPTTVTVVR